MSGSGRRFWHLVQWQLAEARHQRVVWVLGAAALAVVISGGALTVFNFGGEEPRFLFSLARAALLTTGTLVAATVGPALVQGGLGSRVAHALFARGVRRWQWVAGSGLALGVVLAWLAVAVGAGLAALLAWRGHGAAGGLALALGGDLAALLIVGAAAAFFAAVFAQPVPASFATVATAVAMACAPVIGHMAKAATGPALLFWRGLDRVVPDAALLSGAPPAVAAAYAGGYMLLFLAAAAVVFSGREL